MQNFDTGFQSAADTQLRKSKATEIFQIGCLSESFPVNETGIVKLQDFELLYVIKGSGKLTVDLESYTLEENTVYWMLPGQLRSLKLCNDMEGYILSLPYEFLCAVESGNNTPSRISYDLLNDPLIIQLSGEIMIELEFILENIMKEFKHGTILSGEIMKSLFRTFLLYISQETNIARDLCKAKEKSIVSEFMQLIAANYVSKKMVADYADDLCVTPSYLNQSVKKITGFTASYHIQQYLVKEAKRHAIQKRWSMKEVAYSLGFDDTAHFSKFFKNNSGQNFTSFMKAL